MKAARRAVILTAIALAAVAAYPVKPSTAPVAAALPFYEGRDFTPRWSEVAHRIAPFHLLDQKSRTFTESDLDGKIHVASFLFASCPSICPTLVQRLKPVQSAIRGRDDVLMVSYTVTPLTDTPAVLAEFGQLRGIDPAVWRLVTGDLGEITKLIRASYFADDPRAVEGGEESRLLHTEKVLLVDGQRRLRGIYNGTSAFEMERLVEDIATLRSEMQTKM